MGLWWEGFPPLSRSRDFPGFTRSAIKHLQIPFFLFPWFLINKIIIINHNRSQGVVATSIRQASSVGVRFMLYNEVKGMIAGNNKSQPWHAMLAGGTVGAISVIVNNPVDVVKSRIQAQSAGVKVYTGTIQAFTKILREEGFKTFFKGVEARVLRVGLGQAITFATYEQILALVETVL